MIGALVVLVVNALCASAIELTYLLEKEELSEYISSTSLNPQTVWEVIGTILVQRYDNNEEEIDEVTDLKNLEYLKMSNLGQKEIPYFENLPIFTTLILDKNNISEVKTGQLSDVPLESINLNSNKIAVVERKAFGYNVQILWLSCNNLEAVSKKWFRNPEVLVELDLSGNYISLLEDKLFSNFTNLNNIDLSNNRILQIGQNIFSNPVYGSIYLSFNQLKVLDANIFERNATIDWLTINNNKLTFLSYDFLERIKVNFVAELRSNPWNCEYWASVKAWVPDTTYILKSDESVICDEMSRKNSQDNFNDGYCKYVREKDNSGVW